MNEHPTKPPATTTTERALRQFVESHGRDPVVALVGGAVAAIGTLLPFASSSGMFGGTSSISLIQAGFYGFLLLLLPIALAVLPIVRKSSRRETLIAYGVSCALLGVFLALWLAASGLASVLGAGIGGFGAGFYFSLIGYACTTFGYFGLAHSDTPA